MNSVCVRSKSVCSVYAPLHEKKRELKTKQVREGSSNKNKPKIPASHDMLNLPLLDII